MIQSKDTLKSYFEKGDKPTQDQFADLIDTFVTETEFEEFRDLESSPIIKGDAENSAVLKGGNNIVKGNRSTALGLNVKVYGDNSHAEGYNTQCGNEDENSAGASHAEGYSTKALGAYSHSEGNSTVASNSAAHAEGRETIASGKSSHSEGAFTVALADRAHSEGEYTIASGYGAHSEGIGLERDKTEAIGKGSHAEGYITKAQGNYSHSEGNISKAIGNFSHAEGYNTVTNGGSSHAEGYESKTIGNYSHAEGKGSTSEGDASHAEGTQTLASGKAAHSEGYSTNALGDRSHSEGEETLASGEYSHSEGKKTKAVGNASHSEGGYCESNGVASHSEGLYTQANKDYSHAEGYYTIADNKYEHAEGKFNKSNTGTIHSVGIGTSDTFRKNAHEIMGDGKHYIYGIGGYDGTNPNPGNNDLKTVIDNKANTTGRYPDLSVGFADDLAGRGESVPAEFSFRASGGKSINDGRAYIKRIKGNSVVWNQLSSAETLGNGVDIKPFPLGANIIEGHKYLILQDKEYTTYLYYNIGEGNKYLSNIDRSLYKFFSSSLSLTSNGIHSVQGSIWWYVASTDTDAYHARLIDLTQMFSAGNEPTTIEDFYARKPIVADEYAYNEGQVIHMNTESIKSVGDNAWDEEWESGRYEPSTGLPNLDEGIRSKNRIKVLPNEVYWCSAQNDLFAHFYDAEGNLIKTVYGGQYNYLPIKNKQFTTPTNAATMTIYVVGTTTYNNDIMITLVHSGWKQDTDAGYQPYWQDTLPLPIIRKYFPQGMKSAGSAHDEIRYNKESGKWEKVVRIGEVDMGTLNWAKSGTYTNGYFALPLSGAKPLQYPLCRLYSAVNVSSQQDKSIYVSNNGGQAQLFVIDSAYTDVASFKAAMASVILYYELAEPIVTELDAEDQNFRDYYNVADFGTEQSQSSVPSAPFSADIIYQFNAVDMIREHELEITELQSIIATMQAQLAGLIN